MKIARKGVVLWKGFDRKMKKIKALVVGVGSSGTSALNRMTDFGVSGMDQVAINTRMESHEKSRAKTRLCFQLNLQPGGGVDGGAESARILAWEHKEEIRESIVGKDIVFIVTGLGGITGTGMAPVVAEMAREMGAIVVCIVTHPFIFEGPRRKRAADEASLILQAKSDTLLALHNDHLLCMADKHLTLEGAYRVADEAILRAVQAAGDVLTMRSSSPLRRTDLLAMLRAGGNAVMGSGTASISGRGLEGALREALYSKMLEKPLVNARRVLVNITAGSELNRDDVVKAVSMASSLCANPGCHLLVGWLTDPRMPGKVRVSILGAGYDLQVERAVKVQLSPSEHPVSFSLDLKDPSGRSRRRGAERRSEMKVRLEEPGEASTGWITADGVDLPGFLTRMALSRRKATLPVAR